MVQGKSAFKRARKYVQNQLAYVLILSLYHLCQILPLQVVRKILTSLSGIAYYLLATERKRTIKHLSMVYSGQKSDTEISSMAKQVFRDLALNASDALCLGRFDKTTLDNMVQVEGLENLKQALGRGKGAIIISGHIGCWELLAAWVVKNGYPLTAVAASLYDERLNVLLQNVRKQMGIRVVLRQNSIREILGCLKRNEFLALLIDQDTRVEGVFVDFLGHRAYTPSGPVVLARKTGAAIIPVGTYRDEEGYHRMEIRPEVQLQDTGDEERDLVENVQRCSKEVEQFIVRHPTQWVWMHRRWRRQQTRSERKRSGEKANTENQH